ncbi:hypothetical protein [Streptomyces tendae]
MIFLTTRQGTPTASVLGGTSRLTTLPTPITEPWPIRTPGRTGTAQDAVDDAAWLTETDSALGRLQYALPPVSFLVRPPSAAKRYPPGRPGK